MASVFQNHNTNLLKGLVASTKFNCPLAEKCFSECLVYYAQVDRSNINQTKNYYSTCQKVSKRVTTTIPLILEVKLKKVQNSRNISGS